MLCPNVWAILHNPEVYPDPHAFRPSRWLNKAEQGWTLNHEVPDPNVAFGFGRRVCPGQVLAQNELFLVASNVLASFKVSPLDANGKPIERIENYTDTTGFITFIDDFNLCIVPRSAEIARVVVDTEVNA